MPMDIPPLMNKLPLPYMYSFVLNTKDKEKLAMSEDILWPTQDDFMPRYLLKMDVPAADYTFAVPDCKSGIVTCAWNPLSGVRVSSHSLLAAGGAQPTSRTLG